FHCLLSTSALEFLLAVFFQRTTSSYAAMYSVIDPTLLPESSTVACRRMPLLIALTCPPSRMLALLTFDLTILSLAKKQ
ncbi:hypothetical protein Q6322_27475, partial [Klebsiella pneumoniae]|uniref:hypothetical protein n=1 Tax=Klebsiella pneumoniae TaxID=573 RepID=UPI002731E3AC